MRKVLTIITLMAMLLSLAVPAAAESAVGSTLRLEKTEGTVSVSNASGKAQTIKSGMRLYSGYKAGTAAKSYAYISLDDSKVVKLDAQSEVEVQKSGKKLEVMLSKGSFFFDVSQKVPGSESLNIRTSTMLTGVRGTVGIVTTYGITVDLSKYDKAELENGDVAFLDKETGKCAYLLKANGELYQSTDGSTDKVVLLGNVGNTKNRNVLSISATDIYLLEGKLEVKTISGQVVTLVAGQKATVDQVDGSGEVIIRVNNAALTEIGGFAQMMIAESAEIQQRLTEGGAYTPEQVQEIVENAPAALAEEQAAQEDASEAPAQRGKSVVPAFQTNYSYDDVVYTPTYNVTFTADGGGIIVNGTAIADGASRTFSVTQGDSPSYTITPDVGANFIDGTTLADDGTNTYAAAAGVITVPLTNVSGDVSLTVSGVGTVPVVTFTADKDVKVNDGGEDFLVRAGDSVRRSVTTDPYAFTVAAPDGYEFVTDRPVVTADGVPLTDVGSGSYATTVEVDTAIEVTGVDTQPTAYTLTLYTNNNDGGIADPEAEYDSSDGMYWRDFTVNEAITLPTPTKTVEIGGTSYDCTFEGWYADDRFSGAPVNEVPAGTTESKDYYAKWSVTLTGPAFAALQEAMGYEEIPVFYLSGTAEIDNAPSGDPSYIVDGVTLIVNSGSTLTITSPLEIFEGAVLINNGTIVNNTGLTVSGTLTNNGTFGGSGTVTDTGTGTFDGTNPVTP